MNNNIRQAHASPEDAHAMLQGFGYTVKYGRQHVGYFATLREASIEAGRKNAQAYRIHREETGSGRSAQVVLTPIEEISSIASPAEAIARSIKEQIGSRDGPISPLAKQRVVVMLYTTVREKQLSKEAFDILYPSSSAEQFDRYWSNLNQKPVVHAATPSENILDYAETRGWRPIAEAMICADLSACATACEQAGIAAHQFSELADHAVAIGSLTNTQADSIKNSTLKHIARHAAEKRIDGNGKIRRLSRNNRLLAIVRFSPAERSRRDSK